MRPTNIYKKKKQVKRLKYEYELRKRTNENKKTIDTRRKKVFAIMMDRTSIFRMLPSTVIDSGGGDDNGGGGCAGNNITCSDKRVKNIRSTNGKLQQQSRCKTRLVLLLLGLFMNLIAVTNGKWKDAAC